jgi:two-component system, response regulator PdtaR
MSEKASYRPAPLAALLVEDEFFIRLAIASALREGGLTVVEAATFSEAIEILESEARIGAVFSDVYLTGGPGGVELALTMRRRFRHIPCILTSGNQLPAQTPKECLFVPKPYDFQQVLGLLAPHCELAGPALGASDDLAQ